VNGFTDNFFVSVLIEPFHSFSFLTVLTVLTLLFEALTERGSLRVITEFFDSVIRFGGLTDSVDLRFLLTVSTH
jgi:hypothetical protein